MLNHTPNERPSATEVPEFYKQIVENLARDLYANSQIQERIDQLKKSIMMRREISRRRTFGRYRNVKNPFDLIY